MMHAHVYMLYNIYDVALARRGCYRMCTCTSCMQCVRSICIYIIYISAARIVAHTYMHISMCMCSICNVYIIYIHIYIAAARARIYYISS